MKLKINAKPKRLKPNRSEPDVLQTEDGRRLALLTDMALVGEFSRCRDRKYRGTAAILSVRLGSEPNIPAWREWMIRAILSEDPGMNPWQMDEEKGKDNGTKEQ